MTTQYLSPQRRPCGQRWRRRWQVETVSSMIKRRLGETLAARRTPKQNRPMMLKAITHNLMIILQAWVF